MTQNQTRNLLLLPFAALFFCNYSNINKIWRKRVGVEPTTLAAKDRINGFEGHEDHRTPFTSARDYSRPTSKQRVASLRVI